MAPVDEVGAWFRSWPPSALPLPVGQPGAVAEWFGEWDVFRSLLAKLVAMGVAERDPDVQLWWGVISNDAEMVADALRKGAHPDVRDSEIIGRYRNSL
jgi:hypothetical protein